MTGSTSTTSLVDNFELAGLFIINADKTIRISGNEVESIGVVIATDGLHRAGSVHLLDLIQQATRCGVPVLNNTIAVCCQQDVLSHARSIEWSPSYHLSWHSILHVLVEDVTLLAGEDVEDANSSISTSGSNVLIVPVKADTKCWGIDITKNVLGGHFQIRLRIGHNSEMWREIWKVFSLIFDFV